MRATKLFIALLIFLSASGFTIIGGKPPSDTCTIGSPDATGSFDTTDGSVPLSQVNAYGQGFQVGTAGNVAQICVNIDWVADGTIDLRLGSGTNLTAGNDLIEDFGTSATITADGWVCFVSSLNPALATSTNYIIGVIENDVPSADIRWKEDSAGGYASGSQYNVSSGWTVGGTLGDDFNFRVYLCE